MSRPDEIPINTDNSQYHDMTVDQWNSVPVTHTDYSNYWATTESFQPENFSENIKKEKQCNNLGWLIAFWIHFAVTVALFSWLLTLPKNLTQSSKSSNSTTGNEKDLFLLSDDEAQLLASKKFTNKDLFICLGIGFGLAFGLNILHFFYALCAPVVYVKLGLVFVLIFSIICSCWLAFVLNFWLALIFPALYLIIAICWYCIRRKYIKLTAAIMKVSMKILIRYPGTIILTIFYGIFAGLIAIFYSYIVYAITAADQSPYIYIYVVFSFLWTSQVLYYVLYMTISGVASSWYFLNDTQYMPKYPSLSSLKRACTTSFGSGAEAAFILAVIEFCYLIVSMDVNTDNQCLNVFLICLQCILRCILSCLYSIFGLLNRYALIYCATFGVPYGEGIRRFTELQTGKFIDVLLSGSVLSDVLTISNIGFTVIGALVGFGIGYIMDKDSIDYRLWLCIFSLLLTFCLFEIFQGPLQVTGDTILICFAENPEQLQTTAYELADELKGAYTSNLRSRVSQQ